MLRFVMGAVAGGLAVWFWGEELRRYASSGTRAARNKAVDTLQGVEDRAGDMLGTAKEQVHSTLEAAKDVVRP